MLKLLSYIFFALVLSSATSSLANETLVDLDSASPVLAQSLEEDESQMVLLYEASSEVGLSCEMLCESHCDGDEQQEFDSCMDECEELVCE